MRLKNKKTGEIGNLVQRGCEDERIWVWVDNISKPAYRYNSLDELNEEWEDYEEPKKTWFIDTYGSVRDRGAMTLVVGWDNKPIFEFETKEEAEKAVEKLKAWKRLKDKGFKFNGWIREHKKGSADITIASFIDDDYDITNDLDLLFGGEE